MVKGKAGPLQNRPLLTYEKHLVYVDLNSYCPGAIAAWRISLLPVPPYIFKLFNKCLLMAVNFIAPSFAYYFLELGPVPDLELNNFLP